MIIDIDKRSQENSKKKYNKKKIFCFNLIFFNVTMICVEIRKKSWETSRKKF